MPVTHECVPPDSGYKRVDVTLVIHTYEDVPEDWDEEQVRFYIEDNHCHGNYLDKIQEDERRVSERHRTESGIHGSICQLCSFSEAYLGHLPFKNILGKEEKDA